MPQVSNYFREGKHIQAQKNEQERQRKQQEAAQKAAQKAALEQAQARQARLQEGARINNAIAAGAKPWTPKATQNAFGSSTASVNLTDKGTGNAAPNARAALTATNQAIKDNRKQYGEALKTSSYNSTKERERLDREHQELVARQRELTKTVKDRGELTAGEKLRNVAGTVGDALNSFMGGGGNQAWAGLFGTMAMADDVVTNAANKGLYALTGENKFNNRYRSDWHDYANYHSEQSARTLAETTEGRGKLGQQLMTTSAAAGNMLFATSLTGLAGGAGAAQGVTFSTMNSAKALRAGAKIANKIMASPTNFLISAGSAGQSYVNATNNGADVAPAFANALGSGLLEYASNMLFGGTPLEDVPGEQGYVMKLIGHVAEKLGADKAMKQFFGTTLGKGASWAMDKVGEGLEEVITEIGDPLLQRITWNKDADYATADEIADAFIGGVALSLMMSGGEAVIGSTTKMANKALNKARGTVRSAKQAESNTGSNAGTNAQAKGGVRTDDGTRITATQGQVDAQVENGRVSETASAYVNEAKMSAKAAEQKAALVEKALNGELLTGDDVKALALQSPTHRDIFNRATGLNLDESINRDVQSKDGRARIAQQIRAAVVANKTEAVISAVEQESLTRQAQRATMEAQEQAAADQAQGIVPYAVFSARVREENPGITEQELQQFYEQYRGEISTWNGFAGQTIDVGNGVAMTYPDFVRFMAEQSEKYGRPVPPQADLRAMFQNELAKKTRAGGIMNEEGMEYVGRAEEGAWDEVRGGDRGRESGVGERGGSGGVRGRAGATETRGTASESRGARGETGRDDERDGGTRPRPQEKSTVNDRLQRAAEKRRTDAADIRKKVREAVPEASSTKSIGVPSGTDRATLRVVPDSLYTNEMRSIAEQQRSNGVEVTFFTGRIESNAGGRVRSARGVISTDGKHMWIRADHEKWSPTQITQHEDFHRQVKENPELLEDVVLFLTETYGPDELNHIRDAYVKTYGWTSVSDDYILEEICADAYGDMGPVSERNRDSIAETVRKAVEESTVQGKTESAEKYSVDPDFAAKVQAWYDAGMPPRAEFYIGSTGDTLQALGIMEGDIVLEGDKIKEILDPKALHPHPDMTIEAIKRIPEILDDPVLVLKSRNVGRDGRANSRLVIFGSQKTENRKPILTTLDLRPVNGDFAIEGVQQVSSAYVKDSHPVYFIRRSYILHADKKRAIPLLRAIGFKTPITLLRDGPVGNISYHSDKVNLWGMPFDAVFQTKDDIGEKYSSEENSEQEYVNAINDVLDFMKDHDLYYPQEVKNQIDTITNAHELLANAIASNYDVENLWDDEKEELDNLMANLEQVEQGLNTGYQDLLKKILDLMSANGLTVPTNLANHWEDYTPDKHAALTLGAAMVNDPNLFNLDPDVEQELDDLIDQLSEQEPEDDDSSEDDIPKYELLAGDGEDISPEEIAEQLEETIDAAANYEPGRLTDAEMKIQNDRKGMTPTDTENFRRWFHDDSGRLTLPDGRPLILLTGAIDIGRGFIKFKWNKAFSPGAVWASTRPTIARDYAEGTGGGGGKVTLMDALQRSNNKKQTPREIPLRAEKSWEDATDYLREYFSTEDRAFGRAGMRLVPVDENGAETVPAKARYYELQTNATETEYKKHGVLSSNDYQTLASYPANATGLDKFNHEIGGFIDSTGFGLRGWMKFYGRAKHTLIIDAQGESYNLIPLEGVPEELRSASYEDDTIDINTLSYAALDSGYDCMIVDNVNDAGGIQTQYIFRDEDQVKSVYNDGSWSEVNNVRFSEEEAEYVTDQLQKVFDDENSAAKVNSLLGKYQSLLGTLKPTTGSAAQTQAPAKSQAKPNYNSTLQQILNLMKENGLTVSEELSENWDTYSPDQHVSKTILSLLDEDPNYWELDDDVDDQLDDLVQQLAALEPKVKKKPSVTKVFSEAESNIIHDAVQKIAGGITDYIPGKLTDSEMQLQEDRAGTTPTNTVAFRRWFRDDSGRLTLPDGRPLMLFTGNIELGRGFVRFHWSEKSSPGSIYGTTQPYIAEQYARGSSVSKSTVMDELHDYGQDTQEVPIRTAKSWEDAQAYLGEYFSVKNDTVGEAGMKLVPVDDTGAETDSANAKYYELRTNASREQRNTTGYSKAAEYTTLGSYPATAEGLNTFNHELGKQIDATGLGVRGTMRFYGRAKKTLVVDAGGSSFGAIPLASVPKALWGGRQYTMHINALAAEAFGRGYDCVIIDSVDDVGGMQTQYIFRDPEQIKSVYNDGSWGEVNDFRFSEEEETTITEQMEKVLGKDGVEKLYNQILSAAEAPETKPKPKSKKQRVNDFIKKFDEENGAGAAQKLYETTQQMERALKRAEAREAKLQESLQAQKSLAQQSAADNLTAWMIYHKKTLRTVQHEYRAKLDDARRAKAAAVREAVEQTRELERARADVRVDEAKAAGQQKLAEQKARDAQKLEDTKLAERMNAKKQASKRLGIQANAYQAEKAERKDNDKLRRRAAKEALRDSRRVAEKRKVHQTEQGPVDTIRKNPKERTALERVQEASQKLRTLGRSAYAAFVNQSMEIDSFAKRQKGGVRASTLATVVGGTASTVESIYKNGLVDRTGEQIGDSMKDVFLCWDERGKKVDENKQALLQDYMLHQHNIDRMSFVSKATEALDSFERENPWLAEMGEKELAKLVSMTDNEVKKLGKQEAHTKARRYAELLHDFAEARDKPVFPDKSGNPVLADTSRKIVAKYEAENPWLKEKADDIYKWWDQFMRAWVVGESLSEDGYEAMHAMYPHYVPTYRANKKMLTGGGFVGMGGASASAVVKKAKGGLSEIVNIEDSFANLVSKAINAERTNELYKNIIDSAMLDENHTFDDMAVFDWDSMSNGEYYNTSTGTGVRQSKSGDFTTRAFYANDGEVTLELIREGADGVLDAAESTGLEKTKDGYRLSGWYNGKRLSAFISEDMYKSIANTIGSTGELEKTLLKVGNALTGPMKTAITGINPNFALRNVSRDLPTAIVNSISGMAFPKYWARAATEMAKNSENWQRYQALGGTNSLYYNNESGFAKNMMQGPTPMASVIEKVGWFNEVTEAQTRFAEYLATIDKLGDTYENRLQGIKNSAEVTVDFSRKGKYGRMINAFVPYWNPAVQGIDKVVRSVIESPDGSAVWKQATRTLGRAAATTVLFDAILQVVLRALDRKDDWEQLSDRTKDTYYCIPLAKDHTFLKIPKNREWGAILGTPFVRILEGIDGREEPFANYVETSLEPNFLPGAILRPGAERVESDIIGVSQALDLAYNKDFAGRTIVPYMLQQGTPGEQYDADTSVLSRKLGELFNFSPIQLDYIIKDYFGDFGKTFTMATSEAMWSGDSTPADIAHNALETVKNPWVADSRYSNQATSDYYETTSQLEKIVQDKKNHMGSDAAKETTEYKTQKALEKLYGNQISDLNRAVRDMPEGEERDAAKAQIAQLAQEALDFYRKSMAGEINAPDLQASYASRPQQVRDELIRLDSLSKDYSFKPSDYQPYKYNDPKKKGYEYVLDDEQKAKYREFYDDTYDRLFMQTMSNSKYKNASGVKQAEMLEEMRDNVTEETKELFLDWLAQNYRSTKKS